MATSFPTGLDALTNPTSGNTLASPDHAGQHADANDAIEALEAKVGVNGSAVTTSLDYKITNNVVLKSTFTTKGDILATSGASTPTRLAVGSNNQVLTADSSTATGIKWATPSGGSLMYLGTSTYVASTTITPTSVYASAKMAVITVVGGGGGSGGVATTTASQVAISESGGRAGGITAMVYASTYSATNSTDFTQAWEITVGAAGTAGSATPGAGGSGGLSKVMYPVAAKSPDWAIQGNAGAGGATGTAQTPPYNRPTQGPSSASTSGAVFSPIIVKYASMSYAALDRSWASSTTLGQMAGMHSPLAYLAPDYTTGDSSGADMSPIVTFTANGTSSQNLAAYGSGANAKMRLGSSAAQAGFAGRQGVVYIVWYG